MWRGRRLRVRGDWECADAERRELAAGTGDFYKHGKVQSGESFDFLLRIDFVNNYSVCSNGNDVADIDSGPAGDPDLYLIIPLKFCVADDAQLLTNIRFFGDLHVRVFTVF